MGRNVRVTGMRELQKEMSKLVDEMKDDLQVGTEEAAEAVASTLRANAPVGPTGNLARSPTTKKLPRRQNKPQVTMVGCDYNIAPHQHLVEFGSARNQPNPFFRSTIDGSRRAIQAAIQNRAREPVQRRGG